MELVSIIIPVYDSETYIQATIESCLNQTYSNIEVIVINDGSRDNSEKIITNIKDNRIKFFSIKNNGPCFARNYGISKASGQLFQFLDADDILESDKIIRQVRQYKHYGDDYVFSGVMGNIIKEQKYLERNFNFYYKNLSVEDYFRKMFQNFGKYYTTGIWLVPRKLVDKTHGWDEKVLLNNDGEYFTRLILLSKGIIFSPGAVFYYRRDVPMSVSKQFNSKRKYSSWLYSYICYVKYFQENLNSKIAKELGRKALSVYYCNSYPHYPDLLKECKRQIRLLGYPTPTAHGGNIFKVLSKLIGLDNSLKIRYLKNNMKGFK